MNSHLSKARSCAWYEKGKLRDLGLDHIGALHCADSFHSRERHTVPSGSDSRGPVNPGMPIPILKGLIEPLLSLFNEYTVH
jgi:hypothetical protein